MSAEKWALWLQSEIFWNTCERQQSTFLALRESRTRTDAGLGGAGSKIDGPPMSDAAGGGGSSGGGEASWRSESCARLARDRVRMGLPNRWWRETTLNAKWGLAPTYPRVLIVPRQFDDDFVQKAAVQRSLSRFPVLSFLHPRNKAPVCRSAQPMMGMTSRSMPEDEAYLHGILSCAIAINGAAQLHIVDARFVVGEYTAARLLLLPIASYCSQCLLLVVRRSKHT